MTASSCSAVSIKYILFIFNLFFVLTGIVFISVGASVKAYYTNYEAFLESQYFSAPNFMIAIGSFIFIVAFFGCCGAIKQSFCMLTTFSVMLIIIFIFEFSAGIAGYVLRGKTAEVLTKTLSDSIPKYGNGTNDTVVETTILWDDIQYEFSCCGAVNYTDWEANKYIDYPALPMSCCKIPSGSVGSFTCNATEPTNVHEVGCVSAFGIFIEKHAVAIGSVGLSFAAIQILVIIFSCYLGKQVRANSQYV